MAENPSVYDHYRPATGDSDTSYRVVGAGDDRVTLLRLTDADGTREATGELRYVARDDLAREFVAAADPDPRWEWPDYLGALFVVAGVGAVVHPTLSELSGAIIVAGGLYVLWRRH